MAGREATVALMERWGQAWGGQGARKLDREEWLQGMPRRW